SFYAALFDRTIESHPKAIVTEYSWDAGTCDPCPTPALTQNDLATLGADVLPSAEPPLPGAPPSSGGGSGTGPSSNGARAPAAIAPGPRRFPRGFFGFVL